jgi:hypothetical protein
VELEHLGGLRGPFWPSVKWPEPFYLSVKIGTAMEVWKYLGTLGYLKKNLKSYILREKTHFLILDINTSGIFAIWFS